MNQNVSHTEIIFKFFNFLKKSYINKVLRKFNGNFDDHQNEWKELFILFCAIRFMPFTENEFSRTDLMEIY